MGKPHTGPSRMAPDAGGRGHDRPSGPGHGQRDRYGDRRAGAGGPLQPSGTRERQPPDLRPRVRRAQEGAEEPLFVRPEAGGQSRRAGGRGGEAQSDWERRFADYERKFPELASEWRRRSTGEAPEGWDADLPVFKAGEKEATRTAAGKVE